MIVCKMCKHTWNIQHDDKYPFFCHMCGWDEQCQMYIPYMNYKEFYNHLFEAYPWGGFDASKADFDKTAQTGNTASDNPKDLAVRSARISDILERNTPTSPDKWAQAKAAARSKFKVYPSAYANLWAAKKYKSMGGGWKKGKK
jgi:hypothetical protein